MKGNSALEGVIQIVYTLACRVIDLLTFLLAKWRRDGMCLNNFANQNVMGIINANFNIGAMTISI